MPQVRQPAGEQVVAQQDAPGAGQCRRAPLCSVISDQRRQAGTCDASLEERRNLGFKKGELDRRAPTGNPVGRERYPGEQRNQQTRRFIGGERLVVERTIDRESGFVVGINRQPDQAAQRVRVRRLAVGIVGGVAALRGKAFPDGFDQHRTLCGFHRINRDRMQEHRRAGQVVGQQPLPPEVVEHDVEGA